MSYKRKIKRNIQKSALKNAGYIHPNRLAWHRSHSTDIEKITRKFIRRS